MVPLSGFLSMNYYNKPPNITVLLMSEKGLCPTFTSDVLALTILLTLIHAHSAMKKTNPPHSTNDDGPLWNGVSHSAPGSSVTEGGGKGRGSQDPLEKLKTQLWTMMMCIHHSFHKTMLGSCSVDHNCLLVGQESVLPRWVWGLWHELCLLFQSSDVLELIYLQSHFSCSLCM